jgi:preprotein translocase subunit YajC
MPQASIVSSLFPMVIIFVIFYFLIIRPQKEKEKEHQKKLSNLRKNDQVITTSGIHGTIVNVKDKTLILRIDENVKIEIEKNCIADVEKTQGVKQGAEDYGKTNSI